MSLRDRDTIQPTARLLLGVALIGTGACVEPEDLEVSEADAIAFRVAADPLLPDTSTQTGPGPAYHGGVVSTTEPQAAAAGQAILAAGGNAVDAAVAVQFALNVYEPQSSGLGGGGFMLIHLPGAPPEDTIVIDFRDVAPDAATRRMFDSSVSTDIKSTSGYAVGVPGTVKGMLYAKERYGTQMLLKDVMAPAITAATEGFNISSRLANDTGSSRLRLETSTNSSNKGYYAEARGVFRPNGNSLPTGFTLRQPRLATTLAAIAARGANAFYSCADPSGIALAIVETQTATRSNNSGGRGRMTCNDLANYRLRVFDPDDAQPEVKHAPMVGTYHGYTIVAAPPPSSGVFLLQMLDMVEALETRLNFRIGTGNFEFGETRALHIMQEVMRSAFADRARWLGDPDFVTVPTGGLLAASYIQSRSSNIQLNSRRSSVSAGTPPNVPAPQAVEEEPVKPGKPGKGKKTNVHEGKDTTHFTVIDDEGTVVSVTSTISDTWGTGLMVRGRGFMLNNQMLNFNDTPVGTASNPAPNDVQPRKRPRSSITPTMLFLGDELIAAYGSPGGNGILNAIFQVTLNLIDHNLTLKTAVERPRISLDSGSSSADTEIEAGFLSSVRSSLQNMGYDFDSVSSIGAVQAIVTYPDVQDPDESQQYGAADSRRIGGVRGLDER